MERINAKFAEGEWRPIVLIDEHQEPLRIFELYRAADFCLVNSLHDGMNLVAKEFVAARDDEDGVLILSTFAGASRELAEAVLINPFDVTETAEAMEIAMRMGRDERRNRMRSDAPHGQRKQCVSMGRPHADGRGANTAAAKPAVGAAPPRHRGSLANLSGVPQPAAANAQSRSAAASSVASFLAMHRRSSVIAGGAA